MAFMLPIREAFAVDNPGATRFVRSVVFRSIDSQRRIAALRYDMGEFGVENLRYGSADEPFNWEIPV